MEDGEEMEDRERMEDSERIEDGEEMEDRERREDGERRGTDILSILYWKKYISGNYPLAGELRALCLCLDALQR